MCCTACGALYPCRDGIAELVAGADEHKRDQAAYFDEEADDEYEIERPEGTPPFYRFLLEEKLRRSLAAIDVAGWSALAVCGGSGMEAEFLARSGARVITADISRRAGERARERARRHGFAVETIVADVERLPFRDAAVDLVYVHDGLHHLEEPERGLREMARVARRAVSVNEPARAAATRAAVRVGLALEREEAGNRVARLDADEIARVLDAHGFAVVRAERYPMLYRHEPGRLSRALSRPPLLRPAQLAYAAAGRLGARIGNKLTVQAVRR